MTGSPQTDPRLEAALRAVGAHFQHDPEWYREGVAIALIAADAHDEASGVRRVTAQELAAERQRAEVASVALDELPSWEELAEATGATLVNHEIGCSGEYETEMHWPDGRRAYTRDRLAIISADAELDVDAMERAYRATEAQYLTDRDAKRAAFNSPAADSPVGGVS